MYLPAVYFLVEEEIDEVNNFHRKGIERSRLGIHYGKMSDNVILVPVRPDMDPTITCTIIRED